ncbi:sodium:proton antiporter [Bacterioplanes sanyensis]|uniref:Sodium:proton antiporter n=1 Tax=Bacterioplanes sanyensis TaxID=1249553 RepID=A0A222FLT0_9GAMM|nr:cation:proton antiporter [Bacterioplanes sanyensis]ASP39730.1 sodium:proton antiporter [Bacterioplanes sanyensis]
MPEDIIFTFFVVFAGAAILATLALYTRQPLIIAYIGLGVLVGPFGMSWIEHPEALSHMSHIGIIFLLFLLGLDMQPMALLAVLRQATSVALLSSVVFAASGFAIAYAFGFSTMDSLVIAAAMVFSSTIIALKLLPTTVLHHKHMGELMIGLLLIQDILAIVTLIVLGFLSGDQDIPLWQPLLAMPLLALGCYAAVRWLLLPLITRFDRFQEYLFILAIGWCLAVAEAAAKLGLTYEIGAFVAGVALATSPVAQFIALSLKPLRDFFLVMFFFALGAGLDLNLLSEVVVPAMVLAIAALVIKPVTLRYMLASFSERPSLAWDVGFRLGQISEFSLLIAFVASDSGLISQSASLTIQATAIITFAVSSYIVVFNYPNPIAVRDHLRRD